MVQPIDWIYCLDAVRACVLACMCVCGRVCGWDLAHVAADIWVTQQSQNYFDAKWTFFLLFFQCPRNHGVAEGKALLPIGAALCVRVVSAAAAEFDGR